MFVHFLHKGEGESKNLILGKKQKYLEKSIALHYVYTQSISYKALTNYSKLIWDIL